MGTGSCFCVIMFVYDNPGELIGGVLGARGPDGPDFAPCEAGSSALLRTPLPVILFPFLWVVDT